MVDNRWVTIDGEYTLIHLCSERAARILRGQSYSEKLLLASPKVREKNDCQLANHDRL